jgi:hypothetical protein
MTVVTVSLAVKIDAYCCGIRIAVMTQCLRPPCRSQLQHHARPHQLHPVPATQTCLIVDYSFKHTTDTGRTFLTLLCLMTIPGFFRVVAIGKKRLLSFMVQHVVDCVCCISAIMFRGRAGAYVCGTPPVLSAFENITDIRSELMWCTLIHIAATPASVSVVVMTKQCCVGTLDRTLARRCKHSHTSVTTSRLCTWV